MNYRDFNEPRFALEKAIEQDLRNFEWAYTEYEFALGKEVLYEKAVLEQQLNYLFFVRDKINAEIRKYKKREKNAELWRVVNDK